MDEVGALARLGGGEQVVDEHAAGADEAADVDVDHLLPLGDLGLLERGAEHHAGVRDDEVDAAELGADGVGDALDVVRVGDVGGDGEDAFEGLEAIGAAGDGGDPRALVREPLRGRGSDAAAGSGDDGDAAFK